MGNIALTGSVSVRTSDQISGTELAFWKLRKFADRILGSKDSDVYIATAHILFNFPVGTEIKEEELQEIIKSSEIDPWVPQILHPMHEEEDRGISSVWDKRRPIDNGKQIEVEVTIFHQHKGLQYLNHPKLKAYDRYVQNLAHAVSENYKIKKIEGIKIYACISASKSCNIV